MEEKKTTSKKDIQTRLRRIEGQIKGIEKMIEGDVCCKDVLIQVAAVRAAMNKVGGIVLENYAKTCIVCEENSKSQEEKVEELVSTLTMFLK
jgi:DNA-binding FrmR family transcriptional regulator